MSENHGMVWWSELATRDVKKARDYYATVCGWTFDESRMDGGTYTVAKIGERMVAGILDMGAIPGMEQLPPHWMTYLAVDDVDKAVADTRERGGQIIREPWDMEGVGRIAIVSDPTGAALGIMTPAPRTP